MTSKVTPEEVNAFYASSFPGAGDGGQETVELRKGYALMRHDVGDKSLRPGGFISGPAQMSIVDSAAYAVIFTELGITPMAVTSNLNINFLRPCIGDALLAEARMIKLGRSLAVIEVEVRAEGAEKSSAHAVVNYALPKEG
jgi:uncharacterized protein (TIGR00369 family)